MLSYPSRVLPGGEAERRPSAQLRYAGKSGADAGWESINTLLASGPLSTGGIGCSTVRESFEHRDVGHRVAL